MLAALGDVCPQSGGDRRLWRVREVIVARTERQPPSAAQAAATAEDQPQGRPATRQEVRAAMARRRLRELINKAIVTDRGIGIGSGLVLRLNPLSFDLAIDQVVHQGRTTLPNTVEAVILPDNGGMVRKGR
jgi:hypothetical protein